MKRFWLPILFLMFGMNSFAQTLADIARQERARQKTARSTVVITSNTTVAPKPSTGGAPAAGQAPAGAAAPGAAAPTGPTDNSGRNEQYWRATFQAAREDVKRADARIELLDLRIKDLNTQLVRQSDVYNRENLIGGQITATQRQLDDARRDADLARQKLTNLEDELRRSGGPAGWAR